MPAETNPTAQKGTPTAQTGGFITLISNRDGTGNTNILANIAVQHALQGKRVGIVDINFQLPGMHELFGYEDDDIQTYMQDYLWGEAQIEDVGINVKKDEKVEKTLRDRLDDNLWLFPSSTNIKYRRKFYTTGFDTNMLNEGLVNIYNSLELDYLFLDCTPSLQEETLLTMAVSDHCLFTLIPDNKSIQNTVVLIDIARMIDIPRISIIMNKVSKKYDDEQVRSAVEEEFGVPVAGVLPISEQLIEANNNYLFTLSYPLHPWSREIMEICKTI